VNTAGNQVNYVNETLQKLQKGQEIYGTVRSVSSSGMSRKISFFTVEDGELINLTYSIAELLGYKVQDFHGFNCIRVQGVGMDMIFKVVYDLGFILHSDGYFFRSRQI